MKDRGMKKWLSYKSLTSQADFLNAMKEERNIEEKPLVSQSKAEEINKIFTTYHGQSVVLGVYLGGHIKTIEGIINKIDPTFKVIEIKGMKISFKDIVNCEEI